MVGGGGNFLGGRVWMTTLITLTQAAEGLEIEAFKICNEKV